MFLMTSQKFRNTDPFGFLGYFLMGIRTIAPDDNRPRGKKPPRKIAPRIKAPHKIQNLMIKPLAILAILEIQ